MTCAVVSIAPLFCMTRLRADLTLLACAAIWGVTFLCQKRAMIHLVPFFVHRSSFMAGLL
jgi:hypothetical protein